MLSIKIENLDTLRSAFEKAPSMVAPILKEATIDAAKLIQRTEVKQAPHKTGDLQRSVTFKYFNIGAEIYPTKDYAPFIVSGTRPHPIEAKRARVLRFLGRDGKYHFAKRVMHTGTKPNDFVGRTVDEVHDDVIKIFKGASEKISQLLK